MMKRFMVSRISEDIKKFRFDVLKRATRYVMNELGSGTRYDGISGDN